MGSLFFVLNQSKIMFKPLHNNVLVRQNKSETTSAGGIVLAQTHRGLESGTVVAVGPGYTNEDGSYRPLSVAVGDTVYLNGNPLEFMYDGQTYLLFSERDLIGVEVADVAA